jgi:hypothetical protein
LKKRTKKLLPGYRGLIGDSRAKVFASFFKKQRFLTTAPAPRDAPNRQGASGKPSTNRSRTCPAPASMNREEGAAGTAVRAADIAGMPRLADL